MSPIVEFFQQNAAVFVVGGAIFTMLSVAFGVYKAAHDRRFQALKEEIERLQGLLKSYEGMDVERVKLVIGGLERERDDLKAKGQSLESQLEKARQTSEVLTGDLEKAKDNLAKQDRAEVSRANLLKRAMRLEGRVWERKVLQGVPKFRPLHERHAAILSVLNLKGGVGKTTIAAHLGAALTEKGYRVLLLDLDLQGSLSSLFINPTTLLERSEKGLLLQDCLTTMAENRKANLLEYCVPIFDGKGAIVPSADSMAYAELNLTMQWLLKMSKRDTRFLLRKALHQKRVTCRYDIVLLDCPPLFNTSCVNALAASDYVVIPMLPSSKAAERVPLLLDRLQGLRRVINPQLQVIGVLMNRTRSVQLTSWETDLWRNVLEQAQDRWKLPVHAFETFIRQTPEVRDSEIEFESPTPGSELHALFSQLVAELEERLPRDCRRAAAAPLGPE